jgi:hypothetical protein
MGILEQHIRNVKGMAEKLRRMQPKRRHWPWGHGLKWNYPTWPREWRSSRQVGPTAGDHATWRKWQESVIWKIIALEEGEDKNNRKPSMKTGMTTTFSIWLQKIPWQNHHFWILPIRIFPRYLYKAWMSLI